MQALPLNNSINDKAIMKYSNYGYTFIVTVNEIAWTKNVLFLNLSFSKENL